MSPQPIHDPIAREAAYRAQQTAPRYVGEPVTVGHAYRSGEGRTGADDLVGVKGTIVRLGTTDEDHDVEIRVLGGSFLWVNRGRLVHGH